VAVLIAPVNQARIHTTTSLSKHVTFGAWFGAVAAGWLLYGVSAVRPLDLARGVAAGAALVPMTIAGMAQANRHFDEWPNSTAVIEAMRPLIASPSDRVLMDDAPIGRYYLEQKLDVPHWVDTYYFAYTPPGSPIRLVGVPAYAAAVDDGAFSVIALDFGQQKTVDQAVAAAIHASGRYKWVGDFTTRDAYGRSTYVVWRLKNPGAG
jgi:hypothetical protein